MKLGRNLALTTRSLFSYRYKVGNNWQAGGARFAGQISQASSGGVCSAPLFLSTCYGNPCRVQVKKSRGFSATMSIALRKGCLGEVSTEYCCYQSVLALIVEVFSQQNFKSETNPTSDGKQCDCHRQMASQCFFDEKRRVGGRPGIIGSPTCLVYQVIS